MLFAGCAKVNSQDLYTTTNRDNPYELADKLLEKIFSIYQNYSRDSFEQIVAQDFNPLRSEFIDNVEKSFYTGSILEMHYFVSKALLNGDKLLVGFKWEKKTVPYGIKEVTLSDGNADFIFKQGNKGWFLYQVSGNSPF